MESMKPITRSILIIIALLVIIAGCAGLQSERSNYGKIRPNGDVARAFENYTVKPDHTYYISGSESQPNVIIGVDKRYILESSLWKKRNLLTKEQLPSPYHVIDKLSLKYYVDGMEARVSQFNLVLHGFDILDNHGTDIGDWYSIAEARTSVKMLGDNKITIYPPPLDLYERYENGGRGGILWKKP